MAIDDGKLSSDSIKNQLKHTFIKRCFFFYQEKNDRNKKYATNMSVF